MTTNNRPMTAMAMEIFEGIMSMVLHLLSSEQIASIEAKLASNPTTEWGNAAVLKMISIAREGNVAIPAYRVRFSKGGKEYMLHTHTGSVQGFIALLKKHNIYFTTVTPVADDTKPKWRREFFETKAEAEDFRKANPGWLGPNEKGEKWVVYQLND